MIMNKAFEMIFLGYAFIFLDVNIFVDVVPDIVGYYLIARGWNNICDSGRTGFGEARQNRVAMAVRVLLIIAVLGEIYRIMGRGSSPAGTDLFHMYVPETPPLIHISWMVIPVLALFFLGIWLMVQILTASKNIAAGEKKTLVVRGLTRCLELLKTVYLPVGAAILLMEQCVHLPDTLWGNLIRGVQELGTLIYFCFQLMLILQIANLRKNLDCCNELEEIEAVE